jgi:hypothetical protein
MCPSSDSEFGEGSTSSTSLLKWTYGELLRIEGHWTEQIQNQQRRIAAVLAVNGFLLAFLAAGGLQFYGSSQTGWYRVPLYIALILLALGLAFGVVSLLPRIPIAGATPSVVSSQPDLEDAVGTVLNRSWTLPEKAPESEETSSPQQTSGWIRGLRTWFRGAFFPSIDARITKPGSLKNAWLDSQVVWNSMRVELPAFDVLESLDQVYYKLCESVARNANWNRHLQQTNIERRTWMNRDIGCVIAALVALIVAVAGKLAG